MLILDENYFHDIARVNQFFLLESDPPWKNFEFSLSFNAIVYVAFTTSYLIK